MSNGRLLTIQERQWIEDLARLLEQAPRQKRGIDEYVELRADLSEEATRRLREIAGT